MKNKIKKPLVLSAAIFFMMAFSFPAAENSCAQSPAPDISEQCSIENTTFKAGEEVVYKLYYNWGFMWVAAGEATFRVKDSGNQYHLVVDGKTYQSYDWAFKVRDRIESYVDKTSLLPSKSIRDISEGKYKLYEKVSFNQDGKSAHYVRGKTSDKTWTENHEVSSCIHDILSAMYYARNMKYDELGVNDAFPVQIFLDREEYPIRVKNRGKVAKKRVKGMGKYKAVELSLALIAGEVFKEGDEMKIWVSDDKNRLPLMIETPVAVGSVKVVLKSYKGLKYPFTAKVD
jgi:hypothetical protein